MCGILCIVNNIKIDSEYFKKLLSKLQHRGQESFGISYIEDEKIKIDRYQGMIQNNKIDVFKSHFIIGHNRYSTSGKSKNQTNYQLEQLLKETQPFFGKNKCGEFVVVHNGNIFNYETYIEKYKLNSEEINSDTEFLVKYFEASLHNDWLNILKDVLVNIPRAYCLLILTENSIYAIRDCYGVRPLSIGYNETGWCVASESCVFNDYNFMRNVRPGEIVKITKEEIRTLHVEKKTTPVKAHCLFEYIYFLNENTYSDGYQVSQLRYKYGEELARQDKAIGFKIKNPLVVGSPSTGIPSGKGYADKMRYEYRQVLLKNNSIGRTFILENNKKRDNACKKKYYLDTEKIKDRNIILVDDSLVRGTTMKNLIAIFRESGAKSTHIRIAAPPIKFPCYFGVDIPTKEELIANKATSKDIDIISKEVGDILHADSLYYLRFDSIEKIMGQDFKHLCTGCFNSNYNEKLEW